MFVRNACLALWATMAAVVRADDAIVVVGDAPDFVDDSFFDVVFDVRMTENYALACGQGGGGGRIALYSRDADEQWKLRSGFSDANAPLIASACALHDIVPGAVVSLSWAVLSF